MNRKRSLLVAREHRLDPLHDGEANMVEKATQKGCVYLAKHH